MPVCCMADSPLWVDVPTAGPALRIRSATLGGPDLRRVRDPINLVFPGAAGIAEIRAALLRGGALHETGSQPGLPWTDAVGEVQAVQAPGHAPVVSAVQLSRGPYVGQRIHVRLFGFPGVVLGAAHFEYLPHGAYEHRVLSWSEGERQVVESLRSGGFVNELERIHLPTESAPRPLPAAGPAVPLVPRASGEDEGAQEMEAPGRGRATVVHLRELPPATPETSRHSEVIDLDAALPVPLPGDPASNSGPQLRRTAGRVFVDHRVRVGVSTVRSRTVSRGLLTFGPPLEGSSADRASTRSLDTLTCRLSDCLLTRHSDRGSRVRARRTLTPTGTTP